MAWPFRLCAGCVRTTNTALSVATGSESVPMQLAQCWFPGLAISSAKNINVLFQTALGKCYGLKLAKC